MTIPIAPVLPCTQCGASVPIDANQSSVRCRHCGATSAVGAELAASARAYRNRVRTAWADELEARRAAMLNAHAATQNGPFLRAMIPFLLAVPFWMIVLASGIAS